MPELPDLQVFSHNINKLFAGERVSKLVLKSGKSGLSTESLNKKIKGAKLAKCYREGKQLFFRFDNDAVLGLHLMLHGALQKFDGANDNKHTILEMHFENGQGLALTDWQKSAKPTLDPPDPEAPDALAKTVNAKFLKDMLQRKAAVKTVLMDQKLIRGIGNAYADEILWKAGISPFSISDKIPAARITALARAIRSVLQDAEKKILKAHPDLISGEIRDFMSVHNSRKEESPKGEKILTATVGGRKTYYTDGQEEYS
ncbi:MAG TPA: DNA-formamidopyrimidine glycosylase family protein [Flavitalea sp.]|nr:DNA-formamidopyrimidine glycosylase family protein [Flavitalea sp.]